MAAETSPACEDQTLPVRLTAKVIKAESLIDQAGMSHAKKARKLLERATRALKQVGTRATRSMKGKKPRLSAGCATVLRDAANRVASGL